MIRKTSLFPIQVALLVCIYLFIGTGGVSAQSGNNNGPTTGQIVLIDPNEPKGALKIKEKKGLDPVNGALGMLVRRGYVLILAPTATAKVLCGDGKTRVLAPGPQGCPCISPCTPASCGINYNGSKIASMRGPDTDKGLFPIVVSPRKTMLRNLRPAIRWLAIAGAKESTIYNVTLYGEGMKVIWTRDVASETKLTYPDNEPSLTPGRTYKIVITSDGLSSQQEHLPGLGFTTLTADQARALADEEIKRKQLELPEMQTRFVVSNLYVARELYSEAIEQLEDLYTTTKEPAVIRMLGDLYVTVGLNREAEKKYLEALSLTSANDLDGVGLIQENLAMVYENLGIFDQAIARLREATKAYRWLGNTAKVKAMLDKERDLKKPGGGL